MVVTENNKYIQQLIISWHSPLSDGLVLTLYTYYLFAIASVLNITQ